MKIYLASTAPGTEATSGKRMCDIKERLLSYWSIKINDLYCGNVFKEIRRINHRLLGVKK